MDRLHVRLTTFGVAALLGIGALVFGWRAAARHTAGPTAEEAAAPPTAPAAPMPAVELFDRHCGACHTADDLTRGLRAAGDPAVRRRELDRFLASHGSASADDDRAILDYLFRLAR